MASTESRQLTAEGLSDAAFAPADWALLTLIALIWGSSFLWIANGLESLSPYTIGLIRLTLGAATLRCFPAARRVRIEREDWPRLALLGLIWMAIPFMLFPLAEQRVTSSVAGMLNGAMPIIVAVIASVWLRRLPGPIQRVGLAIGFVGIVCIGWPSLTEGSSSALGVGYVAIALLCYGVSTNLSVPLIQRYGSIGVQVWVQTVAALLSAPLGLWGLRESSFEWSPVLSMVVLGVAGTGAAGVLAGTLIARVGATRASIFTYLMPAVSIVLGVVVRDETVHLLSLIGIAIVLLGAYITARAGR